MNKIILTIIFNLISFFLAYMLAKEIYRRIDAELPSKPNSKKNLFPESKGVKIAKAQNDGLETFSLLGAAALPLLLLTVVYYFLLESYYQLASAYVGTLGLEIKTIGGALLSIIIFFAGKTFARQFLRPKDYSSNEFYDTEDLDILKQRMIRVEVAYLSFTFFVVLFNYLDFDFRLNLIKAITTCFVAGNIYYIVFRMNSEIPQSFIDQFKEEKNSQE